MRTTRGVLPPPTDGDRALHLARRFHDIYEELAPQFGYETRAETRTFDVESANGRLMIAVCRMILHEIADVQVAEIERLSELAYSLWAVICNVDSGSWHQSDEWCSAAARARDEYFGVGSLKIPAANNAAKEPK